MKGRFLTGMVQEPRTSSSSTLMLGDLRSRPNATENQRIPLVRWVNRISSLRGRIRHRIVRIHTWYLVVFASANTPGPIKSQVPTPNTTGMPVGYASQAYAFLEGCSADDANKIILGLTVIPLCLFVVLGTSFIHIHPTWSNRTRSG
jgi:hypothetical protein